MLAGPRRHVRRHGAVVPTVTDPFLDLGAGEVAAQLAWVDHLLGDQLDEHVPGLRARIRHEVDRRVLTPFATRRDWHWLGLDGDVHNWCAWIHGNVLVAGLRLLADGPPRAELVDLAVDGLDRYVGLDSGRRRHRRGLLVLVERRLPGPRGARRAAPREPTARSAGDLIAALRETVAFPHRMHLGGEWYLNLADGWARPPADQPWHALHRAARRVGDPPPQPTPPRTAGRRARSPTSGQGLGRLLRALTDPALDRRRRRPRVAAAARRVAALDPGARRPHRGRHRRPG